MGVKYSASESAALIQVMTNNVATANQVIDRLSSGCDHLIGALDSGELQGAAYTAGRGLFSDIIIPSIQKLQQAIDDIQMELASYQAADSVISGFGTLDRDQLEQLKKLREKQLRVVQDQIKENEDFFKQLGSLFSGNLVTLWRQTRALENAEYQISQGITDIQDKLDKLDWFVAEVSQYFTDSLQVLQLAIQGATQLSQVIVDSGGNYYTDGLDMTWVTKMKDEVIDTRTSAKYQSPSNKFINKSIKEMRLSKAGEVYYRKRVSSLLKGHPSSDWQAIIKYYNNSLLIDDKGNIVFVTKVQHTKATVYVVLKNGEVDKDYTTQLNQDVNSQFWQSLGDNAMELLAGIGSVLGGSTLGISSAGLGAGGLALALPSGGSLTIPAEAVAATGFATSGTMIAGGTVALSDAFGKIAAVNSSIKISFAKNYDDRVKGNKPASKTIDANRPIEARIGGKKVKLRVDAEPYSGESGKIQIQAGSGKNGYLVNRDIEAGKITNIQSARKFVDSVSKFKRVPESVKQELVKRVLRAAEYLSK